MATAEGSVVKDLLEDSGTAALGDALFHFFFGSGDAENKNKIGEFFKSITKNDPRQDFIDMRGVEHPAAPRAMTGVVGKLHGMNAPYLVAEPLQGQRGGGVADMAVSDRRLDRENVHDGLPFNSFRYWTKPDRSPIRS